MTPTLLPELRHRRAFVLGGWGLLAILVTGSLVSSAPGLEVPEGDKLQHLGAYGLVMFWWGALSRRRVAWALGLITLGLLLELAQAQTAERQADGVDALANTLGVLLGWILLRTPCLRCMAWLDGLLSRCFPSQRGNGPDPGGPQGPPQLGA